MQFYVVATTNKSDIKLQAKLDKDLLSKRNFKVALTELYTSIPAVCNCTEDITIVLIQESWKLKAGIRLKRNNNGTIERVRYRFYRRKPSKHFDFVIPSIEYPETFTFNLNDKFKQNKIHSRIDFINGKYKLSLAQGEEIILTEALSNVLHFTESRYVYKISQTKVNKIPHLPLRNKYKIVWSSPENKNIFLSNKSLFIRADFINAIDNTNILARLPVGVHSYQSDDKQFIHFIQERWQYVDVKGLPNDIEISIFDDNNCLTVDKGSIAVLHFINNE